MKKAIFLIFIVLGVQHLFAQEDKNSEKIYNPTLNAKNDIDLAVKKAKTEGKNVMIQIGGNWCPWCIRVHRFMDSDAEISQVLKNGYVFVLVNYSKENKNEEAISLLQNPTRFGFPVFVVLNADGKVIHIQDSGYLEEGKSYSKEKLLRFIKLWTPQAVSGKK
jgi:thioredoxin-related protein